MGQLIKIAVAAAIGSIVGDIIVRTAPKVGEAWDWMMSKKDTPPHTEA